jgi:hypothetical protein
MSRMISLTRCLAVLLVVVHETEDQGFLNNQEEIIMRLLEIFQDIEVVEVVADLGVVSLEVAIMEGTMGTMDVDVVVMARMVMEHTS